MKSDLDRIRNDGRNFLLPVLLCLVSQSFKELVQSERELTPLQNRGYLFSFAAAKVRQLFQTAKRFTKKVAKKCTHVDLCQITRARTLTYLL